MAAILNRSCKLSTPLFRLLLLLLFAAAAVAAVAAVLLTGRRVRSTEVSIHLGRSKQLHEQRKGGFWLFLFEALWAAGTAAAAASCQSGSSRQRQQRASSPVYGISGVCTPQRHTRLPWLSSLSAQRSLAVAAAA